MPTYAFSTSGNFWKTRYSFEPDCYATSENTFVSFNKADISNDLSSVCWVHNVNQQRNSFYNQLHPSRLTVVSNENPSVEKSYKALSIESNQNNFTANVSTNLDLSSHSVTQPQIAIINGFSAREEGLYASIGPSITNSTKNIFPIGSVEFDYYYNVASNPEQLLAFGLLPQNYSTNHIYRVFKLKGITGTSFDIGVNSKIAVASSLDAVSSGQIKYPKVINNSVELVNFTPEACYDESIYHVAMIKVDRDGSIYITIGVSSSLSAIAIYGPPAIGRFLQGITINQSYLFVVTDPAVNGDQIRGKYAMINVQTPADGKPFELYAINTEYSQSKLDASS